MGTGNQEWLVCQTMQLAMIESFIYSAEFGAFHKTAVATLAVRTSLAVLQIPTCLLRYNFK